ncbi:MAG TPA: hypothetical protein VGO21_04755 [Candidatus Paceibacterota bacterium]|nr:hypothetical protein [Candidatus Paceibacterota bacterium]
MKNITYTIRELIYNNGRQQIICMNNQEYAGFKRRKGIKKNILTNRVLFRFSIELKNYT